MSKAVAVKPPSQRAVVRADESCKQVVAVKQAGHRVVTAGVRGRAGASAFQQWLDLNPGGTWEQFLSEIGSGATWQQSEW